MCSHMILRILFEWPESNPLFVELCQTFHVGCVNNDGVIMVNPKIKIKD